MIDLFFKISAASAGITSAKTASTNVQDIEQRDQGQGVRQEDSEGCEQEEEQNEQEEDDVESDMENESMELATNREQQPCGSVCGLAEATEIETNAAAGGSVATDTVSVATSLDQINYFSGPGVAEKSKLLRTLVTAQR